MFAMKRIFPSRGWCHQALLLLYLKPGTYISGSQSEHINCCGDLIFFKITFVSVYNYCSKLGSSYPMVGWTLATVFPSHLLFPIFYGTPFCSQIVTLSLCAMYVFMCTHLPMHMCLYVHLCMRHMQILWVCACVCIPTCAYYMCVCACVHACAHVSMRVYGSICVCA